jgi:glycosyltransferase involved in cell wall biosynthesis
MAGYKNNRKDGKSCIYGRRYIKIKELKIAICHDYLNQLGGAERVLEVLLDLFPRADLYTLLYDKKAIDGKFKKRVTATSVLDIPVVRRSHRRFIPLMPIASSLIRPKKKYDIVISATAGYAKGFNVKGRRHICYCYTPLRYAWEEEYRIQIPHISAVFRLFLNHGARLLRWWDIRASRRVDAFIAISDHIKRKIEKYYNRYAMVITPSVDDSVFYCESIPKEENYLMVGRLMHYKRFDMGIRLCSENRRKLKIVGRGPEASKLKKISDPTYISFLSFISDEKLRRIYNTSKGLIFPNIEDFGLVIAEAQMCGLPVIAYGKGGGAEIVEDGKTGVIFKKQTQDALEEALHRFETISFDKKYIANRAKRFSEKVFRDRMIKEICFLTQDIK